MKKIIALLLAAVMLLGITAAFAEGEAKEIIWQEIPWGSAKQEVLQAMIEGNWIQSEGDTIFAEYATSEWAWPSFLTEKGAVCDWVNMDIVNSLRNQGVNTLSTDRKLKFDAKIAGYNVRQIACTFAPDGALRTVGVLLDGADEDDLIRKLETVYGASEADKDDSYTLYFRRGENDTAVALTASNFWGDRPYLIYGKTAWSDLFTIEDEASSDQIDSNEISGL